MDVCLSNHKLSVNNDTFNLFRPAQRGGKQNTEVATYVSELVPLVHCLQCMSGVLGWEGDFSLGEITTQLLAFDRVLVLDGPCADFTYQYPVVEGCSQIQMVENYIIGIQCNAAIRQL